MNISGSGTIAAGEYNEKISISGSGKINGNIRCVSLSCSGSAKGVGAVTCSEDVKISGSCHIDESLSAKNIYASGSLKVGGDAEADAEIKVSGSIRIGGSIKCATLKCSGSVESDREIAAEEMRISGCIRCAGLVNSDKIEIDMSGASAKSVIGSMGGSQIKVCNSNGGRLISRLPLLKHIVGGSGSLKVEELIEGDVVDIEYVTSPKVVGRMVTVGAGCNIDLVQYSEKIEIHPKAKVEKYEKI